MVIALLRSVADIFEPWKNLYSNSTALSTGITTIHLGALMFGGGFAISADRATLRVPLSAAEQRSRQLNELHAVHRPVLIALTVLFVSGVLMMTADLDEFLGSVVFWIKMVLIALLLVNGALLVSLETRLRVVAAANADDNPLLWRRLRAGAWRSITLWTAILVVGVVLVNAA